MSRPSAPSSASPAGTPPPVPGTAPLDWAQAAGTVEPVLRSIALHSHRRRQRRFALGGAMLAVGMLAGLVWQSAGPSRSAVAVVAPMAVVHRPARQVLPDGSVVELRGDAAITIDFRGARRHVVLQRGEGHFQVTKDPARPFVVEAAGVDVRAVGTAFAVEVGDRAVDVIVTEGRVAVAEVAAPDAPPREATLVDAGQRLVVGATVPSPHTAVQPTNASETRQRLAWRVPRLEFNGAPLSEVVALFNRHAAVGEPVRLVLGDPSLGKLPLSGVLRADNVPVLLSILASSYGLSAERREGGEIVLRRPE